MFSAIVTTLLALLVSDDDADALRSTAPTYLTVDTAREHLVAARLAAVATGTDADLLLSIAWHESRYQHDAVSQEAGGRVSCGIMTPTPVARCPRGQTILGGYMAGAQHLRSWYDATGHQRAALLGFAGGYRAIRRCAQGPMYIRPGVDGCKTPEVFQHRARWVRNARKRSTAPAS